MLRRACQRKPSRPVRGTVTVTSYSTLASFGRVDLKNLLTGPQGQVGREGERKAMCRVLCRWLRCDGTGQLGACELAAMAVGRVRGKGGV